MKGIAKGKYGVSKGVLDNLRDQKSSKHTETCKAEFLTVHVNIG